MTMTGKTPPLPELLRYRTLSEMAGAFSVTTRTIRRWLAKYEVYRPRAGFGPRKLDAAKAAEIRALYRTDMYTQERLAELYDVTQSTICRVVNYLVYPIDIVVGGAAESSWE